jgi:acyl-CoA reductase-like NAD-dependent aldehyde dehydrogenase
MLSKVQVSIADELPLQIDCLIGGTWIGADTRFAVFDKYTGATMAQVAQASAANMEAARQLRFGAIHLNEASSARADVMPFGGVKDSGFGHEGPDHAIREMTEERLITING